MSTALDKAREARRRMAEAGVSPARLTPAQKARENPGSLRYAINAKCWDCQGGDADPQPRQRIRYCQIHDCALWPVRPYQKGEEEGS